MRPTWKTARLPVEVSSTRRSRRGESLERRLLEARPDVIGIYTNLMTKVSVLAIVRFIRARPGSAIRGSCWAARRRPTTRTNSSSGGADVIVIGKGEETMHALVDGLGVAGKPSGWPTFRGSLSRRRGAVVRDRRAAPAAQPGRAAGAAARSDDLSRYLDAWREHHGSNAVSVSTMRGCPYSCRWCSRAVFGETYRRRSARPSSPRSESSWRYHPDQFWYADDVFTIHHGWLYELRDESRAAALQIRFECITRADRLNERAVALREHGLLRVWIGAESGSQRILDAMDAGSRSSRCAR